MVFDQNQIRKRLLKKQMASQMIKKVCAVAVGDTELQASSNRKDLTNLMRVTRMVKIVNFGQKRNLGNLGQIGNSGQKINLGNCRPENTLGKL